MNDRHLGYLDLLPVKSCQINVQKHHTTQQPFHGPICSNWMYLKISQTQQFLLQPWIFFGGDVGVHYFETSPTQSTSNTSCPFLRASNMAKENLNLNVWRNGWTEKPWICDETLVVGTRQTYTYRVVIEWWDLMEIIVQLHRRDVNKTESKFRPNNQKTSLHKTWYFQINIHHLNSSGFLIISWTFWRYLILRQKPHFKVGVFPSKLLIQWLDDWINDSPPRKAPRWFHGAGNHGSENHPTKHIYRTIQRASLANPNPLWSINKDFCWVPIPSWADSEYNPFPRRPIAKPPASHLDL